VNLDNLYIDDLETLQGFQSGGGGGVAAKEIVDLLDRVVVGGVRGRKLPFTALQEVGRQLMAEMGALANPEDAEGKN